MLIMCVSYCCLTQLYLVRNCNNLVNIHVNWGGGLLKFSELNNFTSLMLAISNFTAYKK
jgi:hypothetical protein